MEIPPVKMALDMFGGKMPTMPEMSNKLEAAYDALF